MTEQEKYLKEIATELKLIREQLEKSNNTIEIRSEIDTILYKSLLIEKISKEVVHLTLE